MITIKATGAISWRKEGLKYRKNECFIDVIETLNLLMSNKGPIIIFMMIFLLFLDPFLLFFLACFRCHPSC